MKMLNPRLLACLLTLTTAGAVCGPAAAQVAGVVSTPASETGSQPAPSVSRALLEEQLAAVQARHKDRLAYLEHEESALAESQAAVQSLFGGSPPPQDALRDKLADVTRRVAALQPKREPTAEQLARTARMAEVRKLMKDAQTDSVEQFKTAQQDADPRTATRELEQRLQAQFKAHSDELRDLHRLEWAERQAGPAASAELAAALEERNQLLLVVQLDERKKLIAVSRARLPIDEAREADLRRKLSELEASASAAQ